MSIPIEFNCNNCKVHGKFFPAGGEPPFHTVLLLSGFPGEEDDCFELGQRLSPHGIHVMTFNYRGIYQSEGSFSFPNSIEDIQAAVDFLQQEEVGRKFKIDPARLVLGGPSHGGGAAIFYAADHPEMERVFSIAGNNWAAFARQIANDPAFGEWAKISLVEEMTFPAGPVHFVENATWESAILEMESYEMLHHIPELAKHDLLLIGGWDDPAIPIEHHMLPLYRALKAVDAPRVRIAALQDSHIFEHTRAELAQIVIDWIKSS
jgi:uncharacterized protein